MNNVSDYIVINICILITEVILERNIFKISMFNKNLLGLNLIIALKETLKQI